MRNDLRSRHCDSNPGESDLLEPEQIALYNNQLDDDWHLNPHGNAIERLFRFNNFYETMAFVNAVAWIANMENHHPELSIGYARCHVVYTTHAAAGLTENDFICAAKIDTLLD